MGRFLWDKLLPTIGLLASLFGLVVGLFWLDWEYGLWTDYESVIQPPELAALERLPSPFGPYDLLIYAFEGSSMAYAIVVSEGDPPPDQWGPISWFQWRHDNGRSPLPVQITWLAEDLVQFSYCGSVISARNTIPSRVGYFDAAFVREEGCSVPVKAPEYGTFRYAF
ncbi:MAG: hypothetical protein AAGH41_09625 [Pseudomonadota bacterium]